MSDKALEQKPQLSRRFSIAPMMDWTDRHDRYFLRQISSRALLYTEMVTTGAIIHGDRERLLGFDPAEYPLALQLGGSDPADLALASRVAEDWGYNEVNLNVGCPSDRVQSGSFGACLMAEPDLVATCFAAMEAATSLPVTVKCRIGIDDQDPSVALRDFIAKVSAAGCKTFIIHARMAWLKGLSPKENRDIPPLDYDLVYQISRENPDLEIIINGGITDLGAVDRHLENCDGVMLGRAAYQTPFILSTVDQRYFGDLEAPLSEHDIVRAMVPYTESHMSKGGSLFQVTRHMLGLFHGVKGARLWRRYLSENAYRKDAGIDVLLEALALVPERLEVKETV
jgi:tRNA-dihydrouridine synthase A